ncbi:hypothetical protein HY932_01045 [Candidatus Falkowbacteria bacterium]|nr:hypothetical protein [Candidatus Falkowbacteria bacterium]
MTTAIYIGVIILCVVGIVFIIIRRLPQIKILNVDTIKEEKEARVRDRILRERLNRGSVRMKRKIRNFCAPLVALIKKKIGNARKKLMDLEKKYKTGEEIEKKKKMKRSVYLRELLDSASQNLKEEKFSEAEKIFIDVLSCDAQNVEAYRGLAKLYFLKKEFDHSIQIYKCLLKLVLKDSKNDTGKVVEDLLNFASAYSAVNKRDEMLVTLQKAYKLSPNNPKVIDLLLENSIISGNKSLAWEMCKRMEQVNPDNQKLGEYQRRIEEL